MAFKVHDDLAVFRQVQSTLEPLGVGDQSDLYKHPLQRDVVASA